MNLNNLYNTFMNMKIKVYIVNSDKFPNYMKYDFFSSSKHSFGRTALLLSGGGYFGSYHFGFIK